MKNYYKISVGQFGYPQPEDKYGKITYSLDNGCPTCWVGHEQKNAFRFGKSLKRLKKQITGLHWVFDQVFVREIVKTTFEKENLTGINYSVPVYNKTGEPIPEFYQLRVDTILSAALLNDDLNTEICEYPKNEKTIKFLKAIESKLIEGPFCGQKKYNFPQGQILKFSKEAFIGQPDFVRTYEWFGSGGSANRPILVSERVKEIIEHNMFKGASFNKVALV